MKNTMMTWIFYQKSLFWENHIKACFFAIFLSTQARKKSVLKIAFEHPFECCIISFFVTFYWCFEFHAKKGKNFTFLQNFKIFDLLWHETKKKIQQKLAKMRKRTIQIDVLSQYNISKAVFIYFFLVWFKRKMGKHVICDFRK